MYLTPGDPQSGHVLSTTLGKCLSVVPDMDVADDDVIVFGNSRQFLFASVFLVLVAKSFSPEVGDPNEFCLATVSFSRIVNYCQIC